ncbi:MAG TPA: SMP-30/gluconolactonase/LRE family protein [Candidatus Binatia bacterium]|nr:SMP-30/gluconolactonase/LRE family protein [Candidatus Binatia bacterium]
MNRRTLFANLAFVSSLAAVNVHAAKVSLLIDLDPNSAAQTVIVESLAADAKGRLYACDRVSGNVWRIDPKSPKLVVVGHVQERDIAGKKVRANVSGIAFNQVGDLYLTAGGFSEVLRIRSRYLDAEEPGIAQTFATQTEGANGIDFDKNGNLYVSGGRNGRIYRTGPEGGKAQVFAQIPPHTRVLPDGKSEQTITANGIVFDNARTTLYITDTARGAIWKLAIDAGSQANQPTLMTQSALLEGADGPAFDYLGNLWVAANERNAVVLVQPDGRLFDVQKNGSKGPLEFPTSVVFVDATAYVSNFDTPRRDNLSADGKTSLDGVGASIIKIEP